MKWYFFALIRYILGSFFLFLFFPLSKKLRDRRRYERRYPLKKGNYQVWVHVSSEGELEQVMPYLRANKDKEILLLVTSESLEKKIPILDQIPRVSVSVVPVTNFWAFGKNSLFSLKTPDTFIMVRYDFFLELLIVAFNCSRAILLSASLKGKNTEGHIMKSLLMSEVYDVFDIIFAASPQDESKFKELGLEEYQKLHQFDFRHGQIIQRQTLKKNLHKTHCFQSFEKAIEKFERRKRIILGSFWHSERSLISEAFLNDLREGKVLLFIAPHKIKGEEWDKIKDFFFSLEGIDICHWDHLGMKGEGNVILCQVPGLLCELYPFFGHAFVGGGHGRSVHSLLEPFWGCDSLYCGPRTHRSTEADYIDDTAPGKLHIVRELESFYSIYQSAEGKGNVPTAAQRESVLEKQADFLEELLNG